MRRLILKAEIILSGKTQNDVDDAMDWARGKTSRVIAGIYDPTKEEREALAGILGKSTCDVFPERIIIMPLNDHFPSPEVT